MLLIFACRFSKSWRTSGSRFFYGAKFTYIRDGVGKITHHDVWHREYESTSHKHHHHHRVLEHAEEIESLTLRVEVQLVHSCKVDGVWQCNSRWCH